MRKHWTCVFLMAGLLAFPAFPQQYIADHTVATEAVIRGIPESYINQARSDLVVAYQHTSHGTHVAYGVYGLQDYKTGDDLLFGVSTSGQPGKLDFRDYALESYAPSGVTAIDLSVDEDAFIQTTRNYLDAAENEDVNVVMWSWCDITGHNVSGNYLPGMASLISEYGPGGTKIGTGPGQRVNAVTFVFMTGHAVLNANTGALQPAPQAELIKNYCNSHGYFCLDYYSIDSHDMDGNYYPDVGDDGNSSTYGGNFYQDWQSAHSLGLDYFENKTTPGGSVAFGEHNTQHITANRKGFAFWWILARIAGWNGSADQVPVSSIHLNPEGGVTTIKTGETLQFTANVLPADATNKSVTWSVLDETGHATISVNGLLTGVSEGTVNVLATSCDGTNITSSKQVVITNTEVLISSLVVTAEGHKTSMNVGDTLRCTAEVVPYSASNKRILWSVSNQTGMAVVSQVGRLIASKPGLVEVQAAALDGSGVTGRLQITVFDTVVRVDSVRITQVQGLNTLLAGESLQFTAVVLPEEANNKQVRWSVVNMDGEAIMAENGVLSGIIAGTVRIFAHTTDQSGVADSMDITITDPVHVESIQVATSVGITRIPEGGILQCIVDFIPGEATIKKVLWTVYEITGSAHITQEGILVAVSAGQVGVVATTSDCNGLRDTLVIEIYKTVTGEQDLGLPELKVYPNPGKGTFFLDAGTRAIALIEVFSPEGQIILQEKPGPSVSLVTLDLHAIPAGTYYIRARCDQGNCIKKIINY